LKDGAKAPDFTLPDQDGNPVNLYELLKSGPAVVYFYPKAFTTVCTAEACSFRDNFETFASSGAQIVGISGDDVETQKAFHTKHQLSYPVLSDPDKAVYNSFGLRNGGGFKLAWAMNDRVTFVIDQDGIVRHHSTGMFDADGHVEESLKTVKDLLAKSPLAS
jgi:peroxiredoxin Q/BCP